MTVEALAQRLGAPAAAAISGLSPGQMAPVPVETDAGVELLRLVDRTPARTVPIEAARRSIAQTLRAEKRKTSWEKFVADVEAGAELKLDDAAIRAFNVGEK